MPHPISALLQTLTTHTAAILAGDHTALRHAPFAGFTEHVSPNGSTVLAIQLTPATLEALPPSHKHLDLFLLDPQSQLGAHYHRHASAHIHMLAGSATAEVAGEARVVSPGDTAHFPANAVHNEKSNEAPVLFASFQDHPILQPHGSVDYFAVE